MQPLHQLVLDLLQLGPHPLRDRDPLERVAPAPGLPADVREAEELERLRPTEAPRRPVLGGEPPKLDQPRLLGLQLQPELRQSLAQLRLEPLRVLPMLEAHDEVIRVTHQDYVSSRAAAPPALGPLVKGVMQGHIGEQRRYRRSLRCPLVARRPGPVLDDSRVQPLLDEPQDPPIRYAVLEELHHPGLIKAGEEIADIRIEHPVHLLPQDPHRQRIQRIMRFASRPETVGEAEEVGLVDGVKYLDGRPLDYFVLQRRDSEWPLPPVRHRLRDRRRGLVRRPRRYYGAVRLPALVHLRLTASAFPERPDPDQEAGDDGRSRFSRIELAHMPWFFDRAGSTGGSQIAPPVMLPSAGMKASAP